MLPIYKSDMLGEFCASLCPCVCFTDTRSSNPGNSSDTKSYQNIGIHSLENDDTYSQDSQDSKDNESVGETTYLRVNPKSPKSPNSPNSPLSLWSDDSLVIIEPDQL